MCNSRVQAHRYYTSAPLSAGFAGSQRIAIPQADDVRKDGALHYLIGDHASTMLSTSLGSTSLVTDASGTVVFETRYKAWGDVRHQSGVTPTEYGYTGQFSHAADFGLLFYNARWYDPSLNRFAQADTIVPPGVQGLDRYAYVNNSPVNYVDPSGHICVQNDGSNGEYSHSGACNGKSYEGPDEIDPSELTQQSEDIEYSGEMMYELYLAAWKAQMTATGNHLTVKQFAYIILSYEFQPYGSDAGRSNVDEKFINDLKTAGSIWFWCSPNGDTGSCANLRENGGASGGNILNWLGGMQSARSRYNSIIKGNGNVNELMFDGSGFMGLAVDVGNYIFSGTSPWATGSLYLDLPSTWGNGTMFGNGLAINGASVGGWGSSQVWNKFGIGPSAAYILTSCQVANFGGDFKYLSDQGCPP